MWATILGILWDYKGYLGIGFLSLALLLGYKYHSWQMERKTAQITELQGQVAGLQKAFEQQIQFAEKQKEIKDSAVKEEEKSHAAVVSGDPAAIQLRFQRLHDFTAQRDKTASGYK
jgi:hypothetical protein